MQAQPLYLGFFIMAAATVVPAHADPQSGSQDATLGGSMLAEYRADSDISEIDGVSSWRVDVESSTQVMSGGGDRDPVDLQTQQLSSTVERGMRLGSLTLSGSLNIEHRQAYWTGEPYSQQHSIRLGPKLSFGPGNVTHLYFGLRQEDWLGHQFGRTGDADSTHTGLSHTWSWGPHRHVRVGYEYEQGSNQDLYQDMQGHSISISGRFPVGWGLQAQLLADFSRNSYPEYAGDFGVTSDRREFRASLRRSFGERLYGDLHYSYSDEAFGEATGTQRRRAFGLHLRYEY